MCRKILIALLLSAFTASCGDDAGKADFDSWKTASLEYSYPHDGQSRVPLHSPLVLRFSDPVTTENPGEKLSLTTDEGRKQELKDFDLTVTEDGRSLVLTPDKPLSPAAAYKLSGGDLETEAGKADFPEEGIFFTTRASEKGPAAGITSELPYPEEGPFQVARMIPDGENYQVMDFSTLRLQFTRPVDKTSVKYGKTVRLEDDDGNLVKARIAVGGAGISIDPARDLEPSQLYHVKLTRAIKSTAGDSLAAGFYVDYVIQPLDTSPRETLVQKVPASDDIEEQMCTDACMRKSPLTGMPINCVPLKAMLLGKQGNNSQQTGDIHADLAYAPGFPEVTPLRVPRGSLMTGSNVTVNIGGKVPAGYDTGDIEVKFLNDASGYMILNPYSGDDDAPRHIRLFMDIAMTAENPKANGSLSQDLLHLELVGTSRVEDGVMKINALGVIEPEVLGLEEACGILSFHMEAYRDQVNAPAMEQDTTPPQIQSWVPGGEDHGEATKNAEEIRPGDPLIVNFTEALDRQSIEAAVDEQLLTLKKDGEDISFDWQLDGASLIVRPGGGLEYGAEYELDIPAAGGITDIAGNPPVQDYTLSFEMPDYAGEEAGAEARSPIVLTAYPGYPCVNTNELTEDEDGNIYQGRCDGGLESDDELPVMDMPANRPILVQFSQVMDQESINTDSFVVQKNDQPDGSGSWSRVPGRLEKQARMVRFYPDEAWEEGVLYRYILGSDQDTSAVSATIRDIRQHPLQTKILAQDPDDAPEAEDGGPDLVNHFLGAPETENVFQVLRNLPAIDVNSNFYYDQQEDSPAEGKPAEDYIDVDTGDDYGDVVKNDNYIVEENSAMMAIDEVGGWADGAYFDREQYFEWEDYDGKPDWDFTWYTHALNVEVLGPAEYDGFDDDYTGKAVKVNIFPTRLMASNLDMVVDVSLLGEEDNPTGPQIIRMRYEKEDTDEGQSPRIKPITGWIKETGQGPVFETEVDCYLDAPYLEPTAGMSHNLHSYGQEEDEEFTLKLRGRIIFLDDGRMVIRQINTNMVPIDVHVWGEILEIDVDVDIYLQIPKGGNFLNYMQLPIKQ